MAAGAVSADCSRALRELCSSLFPMGIPSSLYLGQSFWHCPLILRCYGPDPAASGEEEPAVPGVPDADPAWFEVSTLPDVLLSEHRRGPLVCAVEVEESSPWHCHGTPGAAPAALTLLHSVLPAGFK